MLYLQHATAALNLFTFDDLCEHLVNIVAHNGDVPARQRHADLVNLACISRQSFELAMDALWSEISGLYCLVRLIPNDTDIEVVTARTVSVHHIIELPVMLNLDIVVALFVSACGGRRIRLSSEVAGAQEIIRRRRAHPCHLCSLASASSTASNIEATDYATSSRHTPSLFAFDRDHRHSPLS